MAERRMCLKQKVMVVISIVMLLVMVTALLGSLQVNAAQFIVPETSWSPGPNGTSKEFYVVGTLGWSVESKSGSWITATKKSSNYLQISVSANLGSTSRSGSVVLESGGDKRTITITQSGNYINAGTSCTLDTVGTQTSMNVSSGLSFTLGSPSASWLHVSKSGSTVYISADVNYGLQRSADFNIISGSVSKKVTVTQSGNYVTPSSGSWNPSAAEQSTTISVSTGVGSFNVSCSASWLTVTKNGSSVVITTSVNASTNKRSATISLSSGNMGSSISVTQSGNSLKVGETNCEIKANTEGKTISVQAGLGTYSAIEDISWLEVTKNSNNIVLVPQANTSQSSRTGTITISCGTLRETITVTQKGNSLTVGGSSYNPTAKGGTISYVVEVGSGSAFSAYSNEDWVTAKANDSRVVITVSKNPDSTARKATITVTSCGMFKYLTVAQEGCTLTATVSGAEKVNNTISVEAAADSITVTPSTNYGSWNISSDVYWMTINKNSLKADISIAANTSTSARSGRITLSAGNLSIVYLVKQDGNSITIGKSYYEIGVKGETVTTSVKVASGSEFTAICDADWVTVTKSADSITIKCAVNPTDSKRSDVVTISSCGIIETIRIVQEKNEIIIVGEVETFEGPGGTDSVAVTSTSGLPILYISNCTWAQASMDGSTLNINVDPSDIATQRSGWITVSSGSINKTIPVVQNPHTLDIIGKLYYQNNAASKTYNISLTTNSKTWTATADKDWLTVTPTGKSTFVIYASANATGKTRKGVVTVNASGVTEEISITQTKNVVTCNPSYFMTSGEGKLIQGTIKSQFGTWKVQKTSDPWLHATKSGSQLMISVSKKESAGDRTGYVYVEAFGSVLKIPVHQTDEIPAYVNLKNCGHGKIPEDYARWAYYNKPYPANCVPELKEEGYVFLGWYTESEGMGTRVDSSTICERKDNHTLYAYWQENKLKAYSVAFNEISEIYSNAGGHMYAFNDASTTMDNCILVATNSKEPVTASVGGNGWISVSVGGEIVYEKDGCYYRRVYIDIDKYLTNLVDGAPGREAVITISCNGETLNIPIYQFEFNEVNLKSFFKDKVSIIGTRENEERAETAVVRDVMYYTQESTGTHTIYSSAVDSGVGSSWASYEQIKLRYRISNNYLTKTPFNIEIIELEDLASKYLAIKDIVIEVKIKNDDYYISEATCQFPTDAQCKIIRGIEWGYDFMSSIVGFIKGAAGKEFLDQVKGALDDVFTDAIGDDAWTALQVAATELIIYSALEDESAVTKESIDYLMDRLTEYGGYDPLVRDAIKSMIMREASLETVLNMLLPETAKLFEYAFELDFVEEAVGEDFYENKWFENEIVYTIPDGIVKNEIAWSCRVSSLAYRESYIDLNLKLVDKNGDQVMYYDAEDVEITCTGTICGERVNLIDPSSINN